MEFKDRLKMFRSERGISQKDLADGIYVSRSAVAKWENGLGIPNETSYMALLSFFDVTAEAFPLNEETEVVSAEKNQKIRKLFGAVVVLSSLLGVIVLCLLCVLLQAFSGGFSFRADAAAGDIWADEAHLETAEYLFYYDTTEGEASILCDFCVLEKKWGGYQRIDDLSAYEKTVYDEKGETFGRIYSFEGENGYYHIFRSSVYLSGAPLPEGVEVGASTTMTILEKIVIKEEVIPLFSYGYFETPFPLYEFSANGKIYRVE